MLEFGGNFNKYITSRGLQKQEGVIFRHLLRLILLVKEFQQFTPPDCPAEEWLAELRDIADRLDRLLPPRRSAAARTRCWRRRSGRSFELRNSECGVRNADCE